MLAKTLAPLRINITLLCLLLFPATLTAESGGNTKKPIATLRYDISGSNAWYPYFIPDSEHPGIVAELIAGILQKANIKGSPVELPPKRTLLALAKGELDFDVISLGWFPDGKTPEGYVLSKGMLEIHEYLVTLPQNKHLYQQQQDIFGKQIGTIRGYLYADDSLFERIDFNSERQLIKALQKGRIDAAILGDLPASYWAEQLNIDIAFGFLHSAGDLHIRLRDEQKHLIAPINHAIEALQNSGRIQEITSHYLSKTGNFADQISNSQGLQPN